MKVTVDMVRRLAALARIEFDAEGAEAMRRDLERILDYVEQLSSVETDDVPPTHHVADLEARLREDRVERVLPVDAAISTASDHSESAIVVPKVVE